MIIISVRSEHEDELTPVSVSQSSVFSDCKAEKAFDKDTSSRAATKKVPDRNSWMKAELGGHYLVKNVIVYFRFFTNWYISDDLCVQSEGAFKKCVDENTDVEVSVYQERVKQKSCGTLQLTYGLEQSDQIYTMMCDSVGDTVRLSKLGRVTVFEVAITGRGL